MCVSFMTLGQLQVPTICSRLSDLSTNQLCNYHAPGYWRLLDLDYRDQVFQMVLTLLEEEDWSYKRVPLHAACEKLKELEPGLVL